MYKSDRLEIFTCSSLDLDISAKFLIDWYAIKDHVFSKMCGEYVIKLDEQKMKKTPQYRRLIIHIVFFDKLLNINIRLNKTGMSKLYKIPLEK